MPISLKTQVECTAKTPISARRARVGGLCGFRGAAERVPAGSHKTGRCAGVRELYGNGRHRRKPPAGGFRQREKPQAAKQDKAAGSCAPRGGHICPPCGQFRGFARGVPKAAKNSPRALQNEKSPLFQGKQRGSNEIYEVNTEKWSKEKQNSRSGSHRSARSLLTPVIRTINARAAASTLKKRSGFILDFYTRKKLTVIFQKPCSRYSPERWTDLQSASDGSFSSWQLSKMSTIISSLRTQTLMRGAIRKCADLVWMKSKERTGKSILRTHC